jgi:transcriptional antiterminator RfaH
MSEWFVVRTKVRAEERTVWHLNNQGFETYMPRYHTQVRHARRSRTVLRPLFPGYVFVRIASTHQSWRPINNTIGVISLVQFGDGPMPIDPIIIETIRGREDNSGVVKLDPVGLEKGDRVRVREGVFADHTALLEDVPDQNRVYLMLELMGRNVRFNVPMENLAIAV